MAGTYHDDLDALEFSGDNIEPVKHGDVFFIEGLRRCHYQRFGTVHGVARDIGLDEGSQVARAKAHGHKIAWLNAEASVLCSRGLTMDERYQEAGEEVRRISVGTRLYCDDTPGVYWVVARPGPWSGDHADLVEEKL